MTVRDNNILKTAYQQGYVGTLISDILKAANVRKGQLYHYFSSKKELGLEVVAVLLINWRQELFQDIFETDGTEQEKLENMLDWFYQFHKDQTIFLVVLLVT